jgi:peptidoglycan hydrolase-like protein with peptidoglycan-binding domain
VASELRGGRPASSYISRYSDERAAWRRKKARRRVILLSLGGIVAVIVGLCALVYFWSGASLAADSVALARVDVQPFGGTLERARAFAPDGSRIPVTVSGGHITPRVKLTPGEQITVKVTVKRSSWVGWAIGNTKTERLSIHAPVPQVRERWLTIQRRSPVRVSFNRPVDRVAYGAAPGHFKARLLRNPARTVAVGHRPAAGALLISARQRPWEKLSRPIRVNWFPPDRGRPILLSTPGVGRSLSPAGPIRLTFSKPVSDALGSARPKLIPRVRGNWHQVDSHTISFVPSGFGIPFLSHVRVKLSAPVDVLTSRHLRTTQQLAWTVPAGSTLRLQQLLAQDGYLPVTWTPASQDVKRTPRDELAAAIHPPAGHFSWRYPNTPPELQRLWAPGQPNTIIRGAVMMFQDEHHLTVDAIAGAQVWDALLRDALTGKAHHSNYSYVYVHSTVPESLNLWHDGTLVLSSPGNTGIPAAPTQLGTFPVFEHIPSGTMSGTNPDGSHYNDPGIQWISYFNGGDAIHAFTRASFGTPQSLGCVELPLADAAQVWPYTPIGTLVTVES